MGFLYWRVWFKLQYNPLNNIVSKQGLPHIKFVVLKIMLRICTLIDQIFWWGESKFKGPGQVASYTVSQDYIDPTVASLFWEEAIMISRDYMHKKNKSCFYIFNDIIIMLISYDNINTFFIIKNNRFSIKWLKNNV